MENFNINDNLKKKSFEEEIIDEIAQNNLITNFNADIKEIFPEFENVFNKKNIYSSLIPKYINSRQLNYLIKHNPFFKEIYKKNLDMIYIYCLFYIYLKFQLFDKENSDTKKKNKFTQKIFSLTKYFKLIRFFYKNELINYEKAINIFKYIIHQIKNPNNEFQSSLKKSLLSLCLKFLVKIIKDIEKKEENKDQINILIKKELLEEIFEIISDAKNTGNYLHFMRSMIKEESIFYLIKMITKIKFLSKENKEYIETNLIKTLKNNFKKEHLNFFYKIFKKILIKFNYFNEGKNEGASLTQKNIEQEKHFNNINTNFDFLLKINDILIKVIKEEKDQITNSECYYCDKGFTFNNKKQEKIGFKVKDIIYTKKSNNNFCILFSFQLKQSKFDKENKIIFSIIDSNNNEKLTLYENGINICIRYMTKKINEFNLIKVEYNTIFNFLFFQEKNKIKISINNNDITPEKTSDFKLPDKFNIFIGCPDEFKKNEFSFNGIIYPILLFELKESKKKEKDIYTDFKSLLTTIKNKYYLLAEEYFNYQYNIKDKDNEEIEKIMHNYEIYYGLNDDLIKQKKDKKIFNMVNNMILYINPYIIVSSFNKKATSYKDYNIYQNENIKNINYFYEFNVIPSLDIGKIYAFRDFNIVSFFKTNNGLNFIILQIEVLFNYILLIGNNTEYLELINKDKTKEDFYEKM